MRLRRLFKQKRYKWMFVYVLMDRKILLISGIITFIILLSFLIYWVFGTPILKCKPGAISDCSYGFELGEGMFLMFFISLPFLIPFHILSFITSYRLLSLLFKRDKGSVKNYLILIVLIILTVILFLIRKSLYLNVHFF